MGKLKDKYQEIKKTAIENFGTGYFHDPIMLSMMGIYALCLFAILMIIIFRVQPVNQTTPLVYNVIFGVTSNGPWYFIYGYLIAGILLGLSNLVLGWIFFDKERLASYLFGFVNIIMILLLTLFVFNLTALVV